QRGRQIIEDMYAKRIKRGGFTDGQKKEVMGRISFLLDLKEAVGDADYILEAVPEILDLKQKVFKEISEICPPDAVLATNTSSLSITEIARPVKGPERVVGTHYFNPPSRMLLLEIIKGEKTGPEAIAIADAVGKKMGREVVHVKDVPGFLVNRIWVTMANEADWAVAQGEAKSMLEVDSAIKYKMGLPMGLLEIDDILQDGAIDTRYHVLDYMGQTLGKSYGPGPLATQAFKAGHYGKRSGQGFYEWSPGKTNEIPMNAGAAFDTIRILAIGVNEAAKLVESGSTTKEEIDRGVLLALNYPRAIFRMADSVGLDRVVAELKRLENTYHEERYKCCALLTDMVARGKLGRKTGEGFYSYGPGEYEFVKVEVNKDTKIARLVLNRTYRANALNLDFIIDIGRALDDLEKRDDARCTYRANALNLDFIIDIGRALDDLEKRDDARCIVITGAGANFSGGADVSSFAAGKIEAVMVFTEAGQNLSTRIETYPKPVIAAINGPAMGGGFEMVLACDIRIMSKKAQLRLPELNLGLTPGLGGTQRLIRLIGAARVGAARAKEMVLLAEPIMADKALEWGIVNFIAEADQFDTLVEETAKKLANGAPLAQKMAKAAFYYGSQADQRTGLFIEAAVSGDLMFTRDLNEGLTSMNYRRPPKYTGQ
ncbi:MAG: Cyclohex-1-ene-1-carboxyl-CoA hydratase, BadK, partial [Chloroflexi bacterium]|nr:Cyclohex-1-ene-1-carboxyl-CoA hydratase, BadK [Chloroflexota bacterium]